MTDVTVFAFDPHAVRVVTGEQGQPWFVAADVLTTLSLDRKALERLDEDEKGVSSIHTLGGDQELTIISEPGLYSLVLRGRKPEAKQFKRWVTHEVLPAIRKTGGYRTGPTISQQLAAHPIRLNLLDKLEREQLPEKCRAIHEQLRQISEILGLTTPELDAIGPGRRPPPRTSWAASLRSSTPFAPLASAATIPMTPRYWQ